MRSRKSDENVDLAAHLIRLGIDEIKVLDVLSQSAGFRKLNSFSTAMTGATVELCESATVPAFLKKMRTYKTHRLLWAQLAKSDLRRSLPNAKTRPIKITIPLKQRGHISELSRNLRWSNSQVITEALQAFCVLAAADEPLEELPDILRLARGYRSYTGLGDSESASYVVSYLNLELGLIPRPTPISAPDKPAHEGFESDLELI